MGVTSFLNKVCNQVAVYWGNPAEDGFGGKTFDPPMEIYCRWQKKDLLAYDKRTTDKGQELISGTEVWVLQDLDEKGYLWLGTLEELYDLYPSAESSEGGLDPLTIDKAYEIKTFGTVPDIKSKEFVRKAYLYNA